MAGISETIVTAMLKTIYIMPPCLLNVHPAFMYLLHEFCITWVNPLLFSKVPLDSLAKSQGVKPNIFPKGVLIPKEATSLKGHKLN